MMGTADPQSSMFYHINLEQYVTADHPMRKVRPVIDTARFRQLCAPLYADTGARRFHGSNRFLALLLLGINVESFRVPASETDGGWALLDRIQTVGANKGYFAKPFMTALFKRWFGRMNTYPAPLEIETTPTTWS